MVEKGVYFIFALKCKDKIEMNATYKADVMKVPVLREDDIDTIIGIQNEIEMSNIIRKIDPQSKYFIPLSGDFCQLDLSDEATRQGLLDCIEVTEFGSQLSTEKLDKGYFSKWGGITLANIVEGMDVIPIETAWEWISYLIEGLTVLHANGIFHTDLNDYNITINPIDFKPRIIDFGSASLDGDPSWDLLLLSHIFETAEDKINHYNNSWLSKQFKRLEKRLARKDLSGKDHLAFVKEVSQSLKQKN